MIPLPHIGFIQTMLQAICEENVSAAIARTEPSAGTYKSGLEGNLCDVTWFGMIL